MTAVLEVQGVTKAYGDEAVLRGRAAFETMRVYAGVPFAVRRHLDRMVRSAAGLGLPLPPRSELERAVREVCDAAAMTDARLRVTVTAATNAGSAPNLLQSVQLTQLDNAVVDIGSQTGVTGTYNVVPPAPSLTLFVRRANPGAAATVQATVRDACGPWPTLVGGGPSAF